MEDSNDIEAASSYSSKIGPSKITNDIFTSKSVEKAQRQTNKRKENISRAGYENRKKKLKKDI